MSAPSRKRKAAGKGADTKTRWQHLRAIFDEAVALAPAERGAWLDGACAGAPELRVEVEAMLAADEQAGTFLAAPAGEYAATILAAIGEGELATGRLEEGHRLGPYRVVRCIGRGGMGEVYEARDTRLGRRVAVKLLPAAWGERAAEERFLREARSASALDHPNICTVHDIGTSHDGQLFIVMAYYEGETLARRLGRGPLPAEKAIEVTVRLARALERAHEAGITHRDIKPANVMLTAHGEVKLLDFGIARIAGEAGLTVSGTSPGTPAYMSPEQAAGAAVDGRSDIWSLGVVLYEMLTGHRPFRGDHPQAILHAIREREPEPPADLPAMLERTIAKALTKDPGARYQSATEMLVELDPEAGPRSAFGNRQRISRAAVAGILLVLLLAGSWWTWRQLGRPPRATAPSVATTPHPTARDVPVVAVMAFVNRTGDPRLDWYGEGVARLVMDELARSRHLHVVSASRAAALAADVGLPELTRRAAGAGIEVLLTGEILPGPGGPALAARLGETRQGRHLAACRIEVRAPQDLLRAADEIVREARRGLGVPPTEAVDVFAADFVAANPRAYESYLMGLHAFAEYRYEEAGDAFAAALGQAPDFTMAHYRLAQVLAAVSRTDEALAEIRRAALEAGRLPDREARYIRAAEAFIDRRYDEAITVYQELIERYPYETEARYFLADLLESTGRFEEELGQVEILAGLEPENHVTWSLSGTANLALGNLNQAVLDFERYVAFEPESANAHHLLADAYRAQGELGLAAREYEAALAADSRFHFSTVALASVEVLAGRAADAERRLAALAADLQAAPRHRIDAAFDLAALRRAGGRFRQAEAVLAANKELIARERVREAMALAVRGTSRLELGELAAARRLLDLAVERSPGVATRYLFARGLLELREERFAKLEETVAEILRGARSAGDANRTAEKAAACLRGLRRLAAGEAEAAITELSRAVALAGYEYTIYRLELARAYLAAGKLREAMAAARQVSRQRDFRAPRLDLELDRVRAHLVVAGVRAALERPDEAAAAAREFLGRWAEADPGLPELAAARRLAGKDAAR